MLKTNALQYTLCTNGKIIGCTWWKNTKTIPHCTLYTTILYPYKYIHIHKWPVNQWMKINRISWLSNKCANIFYFQQLISMDCVFKPISSTAYFKIWTSNNTRMNSIAWFEVELTIFPRIFWNTTSWGSIFRQI